MIEMRMSKINHKTVFEHGHTKDTKLWPEVDKFVT